MMQGYYSGISGLQTHQYGLDVVADNLANLETVGFKSATAEFSDIFSNIVASTNNTPTKDDMGVGTRVQTTSLNFQQGSFIPSDRFNDLAIEGNGWFGVRGQENTQYFTRDGHFLFDTFQTVENDINSSIGRLVTADGKFVMGKMLDNFAYDPALDYGDSESNGISGGYLLNTIADNVPLGTASEQSVIEFPTRLAYPAIATTTTRFYGNLGTENIVKTMSANAVSPSGDHNRIKLTFTQSEIQPDNGIAWNVTATATSANGSILYDTQNGQAIFEETGLLSSFNLPPLNNDGAPVTIDLGSAFGGLLSNSGPAEAISSQSDGIEKGYLTKYGINSNGIIVADFSNGRQSAIGRIAVFHFQNDQGLNRLSGTYYSKSPNSGEPLIWTDEAGNGITGATIRSGYLEASNVRTDVGMTEMIIMQRAYQANGKVITTVDEMIQKALSMHR